MKHRTDEKVFCKKHLVDALPFANERVIEELRTSGVFHERNGVFKVKPLHLTLGFALLLVEQVNDAIDAGRNLMETIAAWLEPHAAMDIKAQICEFAALRSLEMSDLPVSAKVALLHAWVTNQNSGQQTETNLSAYFPVDPQSYFGFAEALWSDKFDHAWGQQLLVQTFLRWITQGKDEWQQLWIEALTRWLGFVHRFYYPYLGQRTDEEAEKIYQGITERLGKELVLGRFTLAGYQLTAIEDDGLMRLGNVALTLISHVPREPFVHALTTMCIAETVMGHRSRHDEAAWIIRTSQHSLWNLIQAEVEQLLNTNNRIAQQTAYHLLSFAGNNDAYQIQQTISKDLFRRHRLFQEHEQDPCLSGFSWKRKDCEQCVKRIDLAPNWLARQIKSFCIDPHLPIPDDIGVRLAPLADTIDIEAMRTGLFYTSIDHTFEEYEPALCAYAPASFANIVRRLVRHIIERNGMALQQLSSFLAEHSLIFTQKEHNAIYQAWSTIHKNEDDKNDNIETAENSLFAEVLKQLNAEEQLFYILSRPEKFCDLEIFAEYFQPLSTWKTVWKEFTTTSSVKTILRILWFISANAQTIPPHDIALHVLPLLTHEQTFVRSLVLEIIHASKVESVLVQVISSSWHWHTSHSNEENHWGSLIFCEYGLQLLFQELKIRVHPLYLGYAVRCRGSKANEVIMYGQALHQQWLSLATNTSFAHDQGEEAKDVNDAVHKDPAVADMSLTHPFFDDAFDQVLFAYPELVNQWTSDALSKQPNSVNRLRTGRIFYETLCKTLLQAEPEQGLELYWYLQTISIFTQDSSLEIPLLDYALFNAQPTEIMQQTWQKKLEQCRNDQHLLKLVIVACIGQGKDWLWSYTVKSLLPDKPLAYIRAVTLLGFIDTEASYEELSKLQTQLPNTWMQELVNLSQERWQKNDWAKHWFYQFLTIKDEIQAWAAFRLFLRCVDSRFVLWKSQIILKAGGAAIPDSRIKFLNCNNTKLKSKMKKNEEKLKEQFWGQKIKSRHLWPWLG